MNTSTNPQARLALDGGTPAKQRPDPPMYPGSMAIDDEEAQAVLEVLQAKRLFRFYGPTDGPSKMHQLEEAFAALMGTQFSLAVTQTFGHSSNVF